MGTVRLRNQGDMTNPPLIITLLLGLGTILLTTADPVVFKDYFDDGIKLVDISQDIALRSCLKDDITAEKTKAAYNKCFGNNYDLDDLAKSGGSDSDGDGLPDEFEGKEGCFYKEMGWVSDNNELDDNKIKNDMNGLESQIKSSFDENVGVCTKWSGSFGAARQKRSPQDNENVDMMEKSAGENTVPSIMNSGRRALGWIKSL